MPRQGRSLSSGPGLKRCENMCTHFKRLSGARRRHLRACPARRPAHWPMYWAGPAKPSRRGGQVCAHRQTVADRPGEWIPCVLSPRCRYSSSVSVQDPPPFIARPHSSAMLAPATGTSYSFRTDPYQPDGTLSYETECNESHTCVNERTYRGPAENAYRRTNPDATSAVRHGNPPLLPLPPTWRRHADTAAVAMVCGVSSEVVVQPGGRRMRISADAGWLPFPSSENFGASLEQRTTAPRHAPAHLAKRHGCAGCLFSVWMVRVRRWKPEFP